MLRATFLHLPGVGPITEASLWQHGIQDWRQFRESAPLPGISGVRWRALAEKVRESEEALVAHDAGYFARRLPDSEHWRLYSAFATKTAFLDIETTGLSPFEGVVTVVTAHGAGATRTFLADEDLEELPAYMRRFAVLCTFNGRLFDVPFLQYRFPDWIPPAAHIDLRYVLRRLGYSGGLKRIEQTLGLGDRTGVEGIFGADAVRLWAEWRHGNRESLDRLVRYNRADTVNLEPLLRFAIGELQQRMLGAMTTPTQLLRASPLA
jgi:uncharacterized protein